MWTHIQRNLNNWAEREVPQSMDFVWHFHDITAIHGWTPNRLSVERQQVLLQHCCQQSIAYHTVYQRAFLFHYSQRTVIEEYYSGLLRAIWTPASQARVFGFLTLKFLSSRQSYNILSRRWLP